MTVTEPRGVVDSGSAGPGSGRRRVALVAAVLLTGLAVVQVAAFALGVVHGWPIPGFRTWPLPLLLIAAPAWLLARPLPAPPAPLRRVAARVAAVPAWVLVILALTGATLLWYALQGHSPFLGHDEAVYATKARSWLTGSPDAQWNPYRPVGLPALGLVALGVRDTVGAVRLVGLGLALTTLGITWYVAARLTTPRRAVVVLLLVLSGWAFVRRLPEFLDDIGAAGLLLLVAYLIVRARQRPDSRALPAAALVAVAAFYLRYGALSGVVVLAVAALVTWGWRAWASTWRQVAVAGAVFLAGLVPHLIYSERVTGSPWGVLLSAERVARASYPGEGLVYYALIFPFRLASDLGGVVMAAGLIAAGAAAVHLLRRRPERPGDRVRVFFGLAAVLHPIVLGLGAHGEERFVFLSFLLLTIVGVDAIAEFAGRWSAVLLTAVAALAIVIAVANYRVVTAGALATTAAERTSMASVGQALSARPGPCLIVTSYQPEMGWYSGCATSGFAGRTWLRPPPGETVHVVLFQHGTGQPGVAAVLDRIGGRRTVTRELPSRGSLGRALIITLPPEGVSTAPLR